MSILVLTNGDDSTADHILSKCRSLPLIRLDTNTFSQEWTIASSDQEGIALTHGKTIHSSDITCLWYRRPRSVEISSVLYPDSVDRSFVSAEWTALLESFLAGIPPSRWISHPAAIMSASGKLEQLQRAKSLGLQSPEWICTAAAAEARHFFQKFGGEIISKPLSHGYLEREHGDTLIYTNSVTSLQLAGAAANLGAPTLFQRRLVGAVDIRVTIVDSDIYAVEMTRESLCTDIRRNNMSDVTYKKINLPSSLQAALISLVSSYGLRFSAIDLMRDGHGYWFLELNPNGQWAWLDLLGITEIYKSFFSAFRSSLQ